MLRNIVYAYPSLLLETLERFDIEVPEDSGYIALLRFEVITPDSFMWRISIKNKIYYLYAEDNIQELAELQRIFSQYTEDAKCQLIKAKRPLNFKSSKPVKGAHVYTPPNDVDDLMTYAVDSGHDFVFLAVTNEDASEALFSDHAPRGFFVKY